jgi:hypothetical protein
VLVDFSRTFAPLGKADERALRVVSAALAELANQSSPPVRFYWSRIESQSVLSQGLCKPLRVEPKLIPSAGDLDKERLGKALKSCVETIVRASADEAHRSAYTDISGALAMADEQTRGETRERIFVILSDFLEDLPGGAMPAEYRLDGVRVLLLHRPGLDDRKGSSVESYRGRVARWAGKTRERGAGQVVAMPLTASTRHRVTQGLIGPVRPSGTAVSVLVDSMYTSAAALKATVDALSRLANGWDPPVTVIWSAVDESGLFAQSMSPVEFEPHLVKTAGLLSTKEEFAALLEECAEAMAHRRAHERKSDAWADISGAIALQQDGTAFEAERILVVLSDFRDPGALSVALAASRVVLIATPSAVEGRDQLGYLRRLNRWEQMLRSKGAETVCRTQLRNLTADALVDCLR